MSDDELLAKVALLGLRASVHDAPSRPLGYIMMPAMSPLTEEQAITKLASLEKPLLCWSSRFQRAIVIAYWSQSEWPPGNPPLDGALRAQKTLERVIKRTGRSDVSIAVDGTNPRIDLTGDQFRRFLSDYYILFGASSTQLPDETLRAAGVDLIYQMGTSEHSRVISLGDREH